VGTPKEEKSVNTSLDESRLLLEKMDVTLSRVRVLMPSRPKPRLVKNPSDENDAKQ